MASYVSYRCPMCDNSLSPLLRLITRPAVRCSRCGTLVNVNHDMVVANWTSNLYKIGALVLWAVLVVWVLVAPSSGGPKTDPAALALGVLLFGWFPALILAVPLFLVGNVAGHIVAGRMFAPRQDEIATRYKQSHYVPKEHDWR
jgi:DNA-directed RNA polymerase subunit RPC12/RpoP